MNLDCLSYQGGGKPSSEIETSAKVGQMYIDTDGTAVYIKTADNKFHHLVFEEDLSSLGYGDMLKSVYATNEKSASGYVDKAIVADTASKTTGIATFGSKTFDGSANVTLATADEVSHFTNVQADWNETTDSSDAFIKNKPTALPADGGNADTVGGKSVNDSDSTDSSLWTAKKISDMLAGKVDTSKVGASDGVAQLDSTGKVPSSQLPSYVDDVVEVNTYAELPPTGEAGIIYVVLTGDEANRVYRWSGSSYVEISPSVALGQVAGTAYPGDLGAKNASDISTLDAKVDTHIGKKDNPHEVTKEQVGLGNVDNVRQFSATNKPAIADISDGTTIVVEADTLILDGGTSAS